MEKKSINGALIINKEKGMTSRDIVNILCKKLGTKSIGHIGTLDPIATGVLVCLIGKYTKLTNILMEHDKKYIASFKLGILTDTLDITGNVLIEEKYLIDENKLLEVLNSFKGKYDQEVPIYSAVKKDGKKLYEYARNGENIALPKREVEIYDINLISIVDEIVTISVKVSKGTYIRSLIRDIGQKLGTYGTMTDLKRTKLGNFKLEDAYTLEQINNNDFKLMNIKDLIDLEEINLNKEDYFKVKNGQVLNIKTDKYILFKYQDKEVALYQKFLIHIKSITKFKTKKGSILWNLFILLF